MDRIESGAGGRNALNHQGSDRVCTPAPDCLRLAAVEGVVQGVGFRPFVAHAAARRNLRGWVRNTGGRVEILAAGPAQLLDGFFAEVQLGPPHSDIKRFRFLPAPLQRVPDVAAATYPPLPERGFIILESESSFSGLSMPPADLPVCDACLAEMDDPADRRHHHPFVSCTACGPRYSILEALPYDRHTTSMADFPMCPACAAEYTNPADRRHHAQTVSCHQCGPVLTLQLADGSVETAAIPSSDPNPPRKAGIADGTAVDAAVGAAINTAVDATAGAATASDALLAKTAHLLKSGAIVAVKGIGGYHLLCDPCSDAAVARLRELKRRDAKPFAVMYPTIGDIRRHARVTESEAALLSSDARPIVLVAKHAATDAEALADDARVDGTMPHLPEHVNATGTMHPPADHLTNANTHRPLAAGVCPGSRHVGAFLPYTPLHHLLLRLTGPLVATSANLSGHPIVSEEAVMARWLGNGLDAMLSNNRRIVTPQDDSVAWVVAGQPQLIRRARGYAPLTLPLEPDPDYTEVHPRADAPNGVVSSGTSGSVSSRPQVPTTLALGGQQKAGWCLVQDGFAHLGEYLGDLADEAAWLAWNHSIERMCRLLDCRPQRIALDSHPRYRTWDAPCLSRFPQAEQMPVQHHHAHIAAVMAEHGLAGPVLGLSFDGTGYGPDGTVWGGEFLLCVGSTYRRVAALKPIRMLGGDDSVEEGWKSLLCHLYAAGLPIPPAVAEPVRDRLIAAALAHGVNTIVSSSMGRLFDAVSALLGICQTSRYEGECAILLETAAAQAALPDTDAQEAAVPPSTPMPSSTSALPPFAVTLAPDGMQLLDPAPVLAGLIDGLAAGTNRDVLARAFHRALCASVANLATELAHAHGTRDVALSGGVFQNRLLTEELVEILQYRDLRVHLHHQVPPNDGGLALGQAFVACRKG